MISLMHCNYLTRAAIKILDRTFSLEFAKLHCVKKQIKKADRISAWMEAVQIAGFSKEEATKLFGKPDSDVIDGLSIVLRTPVETRTDFAARHHVLLKEMP